MPRPMTPVVRPHRQDAFWTPVEPEAFAGSAIADVTIPGVEAVRDYTTRNWKSGVVKAIRLENPKAVSLTLADDVPAEVTSQIEELT